MIYLDLFSGIGGFHKGLSSAGIKFHKVYYSEINKYAIANYKYNYKKAIHVGTIENIFNARIERPNIITFGSPCQDFSLAGKREGLSGQRSSLIKEAITLLAYYRPNIFIWENVKGAFTSNGGSDFFAIIKEFANIGGYRLEWQLLNTKWILPQNRERIYLVGRLAEECTGQIFPLTKDEELLNKKANTEKRLSQAKFHSSTLTASGAMRATDTFIIQKPRGNNKGNNYSICPTITANSFEHNNYLHMEFHKIRRLTEIECERLQGFEDNWTKFGDFSNEIKEIPTTRRYQLIGNAVTAEMVKIIGKKILATTIIK